MGRWQIIDTEREGIYTPSAEIFDDGESKMPNQPGFSLTAVIAHAAGRWFNFMGAPNWSAS